MKGKTMNNARPGSFVNAAGINSDDSPAVVVRKLDAAWEAEKSTEAQEPAAWVAPGEIEAARRLLGRGIADGVVQVRVGKAVEGDEPLYAAPVAAAPVCADCSTPLLYECVGCSATNYPPRTPAAPGIDLGQFRDAVIVARSYYADTAGDLNDPTHKDVAVCDRLLALIDASPKGGSDELKIWGTQKPGSMPKLFGARHIAELNWYPGEGHDLVCMQVIEREQATSAEVGS